MIHKIRDLLGEERGVSAIETIALAAVVLILLSAALTYLSGPGKGIIMNALDSSVGSQIDIWRSADR